MIRARVSALVSTMAALLLAASPASAIQEVSIGPRAPSFAANGLGWEPLALPGAIQSFAGSNVAGPAAGAWAFQGGETTRIGALLFNVTSGPNWAMRDVAIGGGWGGVGSFGLGRMGDFGFTTRQTTGVMAADNLMFYTSVGRTSFSQPGALAPLPPGLAFIEPPSQRMDVRAGFKMEVVPGVTFQMEAGFAPAMR